MQSNTDVGTVHSIQQLVREVNEIFHDLEGHRYDSVHPEILQEEIKRWNRILKKHLNLTTSPITVMDVGTGTGFVPMQLAPHLREHDSIICSDISTEMLKIAERNLSRLNFPTNTSYIQLKTDVLPASDSSVDLVTLNSVLHHLPEPFVFMSESLRILKPGGLLIIAHEPNVEYYNHPFLQANQNKIMEATHWLQYQTRHGRLSWFSRVASAERLPSKTSAEGNSWVHFVNEELLKRGLITEALPEPEIEKLIDYNSPSAGKTIRPDSGFSMDDLCIDEFSILHKESYNHLGKSTDTSLFHKLYGWVLKKLFPLSGAQFAMVLRRM